jgi:hypothetical protein
MSAPIRLRDIVQKVVPVWLRDRTGFKVGYTFLYVIAAWFDVVIDRCLQGTIAAFPGVGTPTALTDVGRTRGIVQGITESQGHYATRLVGWLESWAVETSIQIAQQLHEYLPNNPAVTVIWRDRPSLGLLSQWIMVAADGSVSFATAAWDWDHVSNPERRNWWSDMWIVIYPAEYAFRAGTLGGLPLTDDGNGLGLQIPHAVADQVRATISLRKGAHSRVRCVLFTSSSTAYLPSGATLSPNGTWGQWSLPSSDPRVAGGRDLSVTRYLEPSVGLEP